MTYKLRKLRELHRDLGPRRAAGRLLALLRSRIYDVEEHVVLVKRLDGTPSVRGHDDLVVRPREDGDTTAIQEFHRRHLPPAVRRYVRSYLRNGYRAFVAFRGGELIGLFWWVDAAIDAEHPDLVLHGIALDPGDAYGFAFFVAPEHRGGGTATELIARVFAGLRDAGYERIWGWVLAGNRPAQWLFSLAGYRETRRVTVRRVLSLVVLARRRALVPNLGWRSRHAFGHRPLRRGRPHG